MQEILRLALLAAQTVAAAKPQPRIRPYRVIVGAFGICLCIATAAGFGLTAAWLWLLPQLGPVITPLALAGGLVILAGLILIWMRARSTPPAPAQPLANAVADIAPALAEAQRLFNAHKITALTAVLLAGLMVGSRRD
jgi:hypothetical protein